METTTNTIDIRKLMALMSIDKKDATAKMQIASEKLNIPIPTQIKDGLETSDFKQLEIPMELLSNSIGIDLTFYVNKIQSDYLKPGQSRGYIMNYPLEKLKVDKKTGMYPKVISIPSFIKQFLTEEQKEEIINRWEEKFEGWGNGKDENFVQVKFRK